MNSFVHDLRELSVFDRQTDFIIIPGYAGLSVTSKRWLIGCGIYGNSLSFQLMYVCVAGLRFLRERFAACTLLFCLAYIDQLASTECVQSHGNKLSSMLPEHDCSSAVCRESITRKSLRSLPPEFFVCSLWYMLMSLGLLLGVNSR